MKLSQKITVILAIAMIIVVGVSRISFAADDAVADATSTDSVVTYKQSFSANINGAQEVASTTSAMTGYAIFNVSMDERNIDYIVNATNGNGITDIVLACAQPGLNGPTVVSFLHNSTGVAASTALTTGTIVISDITSDASACTPNIHTTSHLVQAMREGSIYINVLTTAYPQGEIRGNLMDGLVTPISIGGSNNGTGGNTGGDNGGTTGTTTGGTIDGNNGGGSDTGTSTVATTTPVTTGGSDSSTSTTTTPDTTLVVNYGSGTQGYATFGPYAYGTMGGTTCSAGITSYLKMGGNNNFADVVTLQKFLNIQMNAGLPVTGYFGPLTFAAVKQFQLKYAADILKPWVAYGLPNETAATGFVYKTTMWKINSLACGVTLPMPQLP